MYYVSNNLISTNTHVIFPDTNSDIFYSQCTFAQNKNLEIYLGSVEFYSSGGFIQLDPFGIKTKSNKEFEKQFAIYLIKLINGNKSKIRFIFNWDSLVIGSDGIKIYGENINTQNNKKFLTNIENYITKLIILI
jgi:hypothetical protein